MMIDLPSGRGDGTEVAARNWEGDLYECIALKSTVEDALTSHDSSIEISDQRQLELVEPSRHRSVRLAASRHTSRPLQRQTPMTRLRQVPTGDQNGLPPNPRLALLLAYLRARQPGEGP